MVAAWFTPHLRHEGEMNAEISWTADGSAGAQFLG
jgi:hypothetical protein